MRRFCLITTWSNIKILPLVIIIFVIMSLLRVAPSWRTGCVKYSSMKMAISSIGVEIFSISFSFSEFDDYKKFCLYRWHGSLVILISKWFPQVGTSENQKPLLKNTQCFYDSRQKRVISLFTIKFLLKCIIDVIFRVF